MKTIVSLSIDPDLLAKVDQVWRTLLYKNRSEFISKALTYYLAPKKINDKR